MRRPKRSYDRVAWLRISPVADLRHRIALERALRCQPGYMIDRTAAVGLRLARLKPRLLIAICVCPQQLLSSRHRERPVPRHCTICMSRLSHPRQRPGGPTLRGSGRFLHASPVLLAAVRANNEEHAKTRRSQSAESFECTEASREGER